jgi:hypothetical protein
MGLQFVGRVSGCGVNNVGIFILGELLGPHGYEYEDLGCSSMWSGKH